MRIRREPEIQIKTAQQIALMRAAGLVVARALTAAAGAVGPGVSTADLDAVADEEIRAAGAVPSFKGYHGFPATICASVNDEIVHGIPSAKRKLRRGDVVSIDCGAIVEGWHADAALTVGVGAISEELTQLIAACEQALWRGLAQAQVGARLSDISYAVERSARDSAGTRASASTRGSAGTRGSASAGAPGSYGIVEDYVGHGIGSEMHMDPPVPNHGKPGRGPVLAEGMALAIEPLLVLGQPDTVLLDDGWTVVSADGTWAAHFEHTVAITAEGPWVLTAPDGGRGWFSQLAEPAAGSAGGLADSAARPQV